MTLRAKHIKISKGDEFYVITKLAKPEVPNELYITRDNGEQMGLRESALFELIDKYFKENL